MDFKPTTPQSEAGCLIDPPVSVPKANKHVSAATPAAEPEDDPPGTLSGFQGFLVSPYAEFSPDEPIANSSQLVFPMIDILFARSLSTAVAS